MTVSVLSYEKKKILIMSSVSSTLWVFYRGLIKCLCDSGYEVTVAASNDCNLGRFRTDYGCEILPVNISRQMNPFQDIKCIAKLFRIMKNEKFDLVHAHTPKAGMIGMIAAFLAKVPARVYTLHGLPLETATGFKRIIYRVVERLTFKCAAHRLIVSQSLARRAVELGICDRDDFQILGDGSACGVDRSLFFSANKTPQSVARTKGQLDIPTDSIVIGFVGRVTPDKGIDRLLNMFEQLSQHYADLYLLIIADYDNARGQSVCGYRCRIEQHPRIKHLTFVDNIVPYYHAMDLLVLPSRREGFNYALLEAAACGLPTVTTNATGCVDVVVDQQTGFVVRLEDQSAFNEAVKRLVDNTGLRQELGQKAKKRVAECFDSKRLVQKHIRLYEKVLNRTFIKDRELTDEKK